MLPPLAAPTKEVDVDFLVFVERYISDLLKWDILAFFAHNPDLSATPSKIARGIGRSAHLIRPELGDLVLLGIFDRVETSDHKTLYRLSQEPRLRKMILKFADQLTTRS